MTIAMYRMKPNFRIRSHADVQTFLDEILVSGSYTFVVEKGLAIFVTKAKSGECKVSVKIGNLYDPFNPEVRIYDDKIVKYIYGNRRSINHIVFDYE